jgi:hypothetical protein
MDLHSMKSPEIRSRMAHKAGQNGTRGNENEIVLHWRGSQCGALRHLNSISRNGIPLLWLLPVFALLLCPACAKVGEPQPPIIYIPQPSLDLACRQVADQVALSVSFPSVNTNGTPVNTLKTVEVFRLDLHPAQAATPLTEGNLQKSGAKILSISEAEFPKYRQDNKLVFSDPLPLHEGAELYSKARIYAVRFINKKGQSAGFGNQISMTPVPVPAPPVFLPADISQETIRLKWVPPAENLDGSEPARILGYNIYRSTDSPDLPDTPLNLKPLQQPEFDDHSFEFDKSYAYAVSVVASEPPPFAESFPSKILSIIPRDTFPPGVPGNLNAVAESGAVILLWMPPSDSDVAGYKVYRSDSVSKVKNLLAAELIKTFSYRDLTARPGRIYEYSVTAVDKHDNESAAASAAVDMQ